MLTESELEQRCKIAEAKLGVAEQLRLPMASLAGLLAYSYWKSWIISFVVIVVFMYIVPYWYDKDYEKKMDDYEKFTGTGKYCNHKK